jgi:predicted nucleic acid-binding OB-fold protein
LVHNLFIVSYIVRRMIKMREDQFIRFLENDSNIESKVKAVSSRLSRARKVEDTFGINLDEVVKNDYTTYKLLKEIRGTIDVNSNGNYGNAVRKYYLFINQKQSPTLSRYERIHSTTSKYMSEFSQII